MKLVAAAATIGAHATVLAVLAAVDVDVPLPPQDEVELTTVTLVELPEVELPKVELPEPVDVELPEPEAPPEPAPSPKADPPPTAPKPAPAPRPDVPADAPTGRDAAVTAAPAAPAPEGPTKSPEGPTGPRRRKLGGELTNARAAGSAPKKAGCDEAPVRPKILSRVNPRFPAAAKAGGVEGELKLIAHVSGAGVVSRVEVEHALHPSVDAPAKAALLQWTFEPATRCGKPVPSKVHRGWRFAPKD